MISRNKREGRYAGYDNKHVRQPLLLKRRYVYASLARCILQVREVTSRINKDKYAK